MIDTLYDIYLTLKDNILLLSYLEDLRQKTGLWYTFIL